MPYGGGYVQVALRRDAERVRALLLQGAHKARAIATPFMAQLRSAVGLRGLASQAQAAPTQSAKVALVSFKQYREKDGLFYFKLVDATGSVLLQSQGFESPKVAGQSIAQLLAQGADALTAQQNQLQPLTTQAYSKVLAALTELSDANENK